jgi:hypothetical protein
VSREWLGQLWQYINTECSSLKPFADSGVPIIPTTAGTLVSLLPSELSIIVADGSFAAAEDLMVRARVCKA